MKIKQLLIVCLLALPAFMQAQKLYTYPIGVQAYTFRNQFPKDVFSLNDLKFVLFGYEKKYIATQIISEFEFEKWIDELCVFLKENINKLFSKELQINLNKQKIIDSENYFNEAENRYLINKVDDLWHAKDYPNLVKVIEDYKGEIPELIRKKYLYSLKMIKK